jgi:BASS family bile acid:Na+ symporter
LSPIIIPVAFNVFGEMASDGSGVFLGLWVVLPSLLGIAVRLIICHDWQTDKMHYFKFINSIVLLLLNYSNTSVSLPQAIADRDYDFLACTLAISAGLCLTLFAAGLL